MRLVWAPHKALHPLFIYTRILASTLSLSLHFSHTSFTSPLSFFLSPLNPDLSTPFSTFSTVAHRDLFPGLICISKGAGGSLYQAVELSRAVGWILKQSLLVFWINFSVVRHREGCILVTSLPFPSNYCMFVSSVYSWLYCTLHCFIFLQIFSHIDLKNT